jgi:MFS family permease
MKKILFFLLIMALLIPFPASAEVNDLYPKGEFKTEAQYNQHNLDNLRLDMQQEDNSSWYDIGGKVQESTKSTMMMLLNTGWVAVLYFSRFVITAITQAFELSIIDSLADVIGGTIKKMQNGLWDAFILLVISIVGAFLGYKGIIQREMSNAVGSMISFLIIFIVSLYWMNDAGNILKNANQVSSELSQEVLGIGTSITTENQDKPAVVRSGEQMYDLMIYKPYMYLQFGTFTVPENNASMVLDKPVDNQERQRFVENQAQENKMMTPEGLPDRAVFLLLISIANLIIGLILIIFSALIVWFQLMFIILAFFAPFILMIALIPSWQFVARNYFLKLLGAISMKVVYAAMLAVLFTISAVLYKVAGDGQLGYLMTVLLQIVLCIGIMAKRHDLFGALLVHTGGETGGRLSSLYIKDAYDRYSNMRKQYKNNQMRKALIRRTSGGKPMPLADRSSWVDRNMPSENVREAAASNTATRNKNAKTPRFLPLVDRFSSAPQQAENIPSDREVSATGTDGQVESPNDNRLLKRRGIKTVPVGDRRTLKNSETPSSGKSAIVDERPVVQNPRVLFDRRTGQDVDITERSGLESNQRLNREEQNSIKETIQNTRNDVSERTLIDRNRQETVQNQQIESQMIDRNNIVRNVVSERVTSENVNKVNRQALYERTKEINTGERHVEKQIIQQKHVNREE